MEARSRNVIFWESSASSLGRDYFCTLLPFVTGIRRYSSAAHRAESELPTDEAVAACRRVQSCAPYCCGQHAAIRAANHCPNGVGEDLPVL